MCELQEIQGSREGGGDEVFHQPLKTLYHHDYLNEVVVQGWVFLTDCLKLLRMVHCERGRLKMVVNTIASWSAQDRRTCTAISSGPAAQGHKFGLNFGRDTSQQYHHSNQMSDVSHAQEQTAS